MSPHNDVSLPV